MFTQRVISALSAALTVLTVSTVPVLATPKEFYSGDGTTRLQDRYALVIAVPEVRFGFNSLKNPANDAKAVSDALKALGFRSVINLFEQVGRDPAQMTRQAIKFAVYDFVKKIKGTSAIGLVYFAGHGLQYKKSGRRYLVPYDGHIEYERDLHEEMIPLQFIYDAFSEAGNPLNLLFLDTCRDDPYENSLNTFPGTAQSRVLRLTRESNSVVVSAAMPSKTANDGIDGHSPFTRAFLKSITFWDENFDNTYKRMKYYTKQFSGGQETSKEDNAGVDFYFATSKSTFEQERAAWLEAKGINTKSVYDQHQQWYTGGYFYKAAQSAWRDAPATRATTTVQPAEPPTDPVAQPGAPEHDEASLILPNFRVRTEAAGETVAFIPKDTLPKPIVPTSPAKTDADGSKWFEFFLPHIGQKLAISEKGLKNPPSADNFVQLPITTKTKFVANTNGGALPLQQQAATGIDLVKVNPNALPITNVQIPVYDLQDTTEKKQAWFDYLKKAAELRESGADLSFANVEYVKRNPDVHGDLVATVGFWKEGMFSKEQYLANTQALTKDNFIPEAAAALSPLGAAALFAQ